MAVPAPAGSLPRGHARPLRHHPPVDPAISRLLAAVQCGPSAFRRTLQQLDADALDEAAGG